MIPEWMKEEDNYIPQKDKNSFVLKTIRGIGDALSRIQFQKGRESKHSLPALFKLLLMIAAILILSLSHNRLVLLFFFAVIEGYVCLMPAKEILSILKAALAGGLLSLLLFLPAMIFQPLGRGNNLAVVIKVFLSVEMISIYNRTTQWNHVTDALRKLHVPGVFIFTLDITLKYIVLLGNLIKDLLTSLELRSVGKNHKKYQSIGGVMGVTFLRSTQMSTELYEAMRCRGFTDDYKGL